MQTVGLVSNHKGFTLGPQTSDPEHFRVEGHDAHDRHLAGRPYYGLLVTTPRREWPLQQICFEVAKTAVVIANDAGEWGGR